MEENKEKKNNAYTIISIVIIIMLTISLAFLVWKNQQLTEKVKEYEDSCLVYYSNSLNNYVKTNEIAEESSNITNDVQDTNENEQLDNSTKNNNSIDVTTVALKRWQDCYSDDDTEEEKAKKIATELMNAVNNKDWYYVAKMVGGNSDLFIKYGISDYNINANECMNLGSLNGSEFEGEYAFSEKYDWDKTKVENPESFGGLLIIKFEDGGRIEIDPLCTGW